MEILELPTDPAALDALIDSLPDSPAVFALWPQEGSPYLARTNLFRRRAARLLRARVKPSRLLNLRETARRLEYQLTASAFESSLVLYDFARRISPRGYLETLRLRMPPYVKLILSNEFPRCQVTTQLSGAQAVFYGPFRSRVAAERFEGEFLDLFQLRRCQEDLAPSSEHPGCIYGEMGKCLRPCQQLVGVEEYRHETLRVAAFLQTNGGALIENVTSARDRMSAEMEFEAAAAHHRRLERILEILKLRDELAGPLDALNGVAVHRSVARNSLELRFVLGGQFAPPIRMSLEFDDGKPVSLDKRLKELTAGLGEIPRASARERQEHCALLARWFYSTWRDGEWVSFDSLAALPYRRMVNALARVAAGNKS